MKNETIREDQMLFGSAMTVKPHMEDAIADIIAQVEGQMQGRPIDFVQVFLTPHFRLLVNDILLRLRKALQPEILIGCTAESIIGREQEIEQKPGITLVAARLPNVTLTPFKLQSMKWDETLGQAEAFHATIGAPADTKLFVLLSDPFTTPMDRILDAFNSYYPDLPIIGGLASGSHRPGGNALLFNDRTLNNGAVGVAFSGALDVDIIVSQGCRPVGRPFTVTEVQENSILSLEGQTPLSHLQALVNELTSEDQSLLQNGLFIGRAIDSTQDTLGRGDFLIRGVMGIDREDGSMVVGDYVNSGEIIQFHLRDATTAEEDLEMMLTPQMLYEPAAGGMLFSCNGRGTRLYDHPNGDISTIQKVVGDINLAGFFCAGEIGPVGGKNFLHGHTASLALFRPLGGEG